MKKIFTKYLNLVFVFTLLCSISLTSVGQNTYNHFNEFDAKLDMQYMHIHDQYKMKLDPKNYDYSENQRNVDNDYLLFLMDVAVINSVFSNPKRHIYTYTPDNNYLDNTLTQEEINGNWEILSIESFTYDTVGNVLTSQLRVWDGSNLENVSRSTFAYNASNNIDTFYTELWINNSWTNSDRGTYEYNTSGNVLSYLTENWENNDWEYNTNEIYTYDSQGHLLTAEGSIWMGNGWATDRRHNYTYDSGGNLTEGLSEIYVGDTAWANLYKETYTYNGANNRLTFLGQNWEAGWVNNLNYMYSYDGLGFLSNMIIQMWESGDWLNQIQEDYYYNDFGGIETVYTQVWETGSWVNSTNSQNTYDQHGNTTKGQFFDWEDGNWGHTFDGVIKAYYNYSLDVNYFTGYLADISYVSIIVGENEIEENKASKFACHPNPISNRSTLSVTVGNDSDTEIGIYNIAGKKIQ